MGLIIESLFPSFVPILIAQVVWGVGYTFTSGATQAWLSDEIGEERANRAFLTANRYGMTGGLVGVLAKVFSVPLALGFCGGLLAPAMGFIVRANQAQPAPDT